VSRRNATLSTAAVLLVALVAVAALFPVPYVVYSPGPIEDVLGEVDGQAIISIEGAETYPTSGRLDLTTVGVTSASRELGLLSALRAWVDPRYAVVPRELVYPDDVTPDEVRQENAELMSRSQESAKVAAIRQAGGTVTESVVIEAVLEGAPAQDRLRAGDVVRAVDATPVTDAEQVRDLVRQREPGQDVVFDVERDGEPVSVTVPTEPSPEDPAVPVVGVTPAPGFDLPYEVDIALGDEIGGPSAGLMFSVAIYDLLTPDPLTGGEHVAGTGTITPEGEVGPIGGIQQKIVAADDAGAAVFLAPAGNCEEARGASGDIPVVRVATLDDAIAAVRAVAAGDLADLSRC
jgi:PDZ domain-containing protein